MKDHYAPGRGPRSKAGDECVAKNVSRWDNVRNRNMAQALECVVEAVITAVDRRFQSVADDDVDNPFSLDAEAMFSVVRVDSDSFPYPKITTHGPWDNEPRAQRAAARLRGRTFVLGPVAMARYRRRT
jgi:hypothetical protein